MFIASDVYRFATRSLFPDLPVRWWRYDVIQLNPSWNYCVALSVRNKGILTAICYLTAATLKQQQSSSRCHLFFTWGETRYIGEDEVGPRLNGLAVVAIAIYEFWITLGSQCSLAVECVGWQVVAYSSKGERLEWAAYQVWCGNRLDQRVSVNSWWCFTLISPQLTFQLAIRRNGRTQDLTMWSTSPIYFLSSTFPNRCHFSAKTSPA